MPTPIIVVFAATFGVTFIICALILFKLRQGAVKITKDEALVVTRLGNSRPRVRFVSMHFAWPAAPEVVPLAPFTMAVERTGSESLHARDGQRVEMSVEFTFALMRDPDSIVMAAQQVGSDNLHDPECMERLFLGVCQEGVLNVVSKFKAAEVKLATEEMENMLDRYIGTDLNGFCLEKVAVKRVALAPDSVYDPENLMDLRWLARKAS